MLVDPDVLRAFADEVNIAGQTLDGLDVGGVASTSADGLSGSSAQWAARQVGGHLGLAASDIASDIDAMGSAVRGAGDRYEVADDALAGSFEGLF